MKNSDEIDSSYSLRFVGRTGWGPAIRDIELLGGTHMLGDRWICDRVPTDRFPDYTRGNAGEVLADPVSPLAWSFCWEPGPVQGCVDGFEQMGVFDRIEYGDPPASFGLFGGYFYNSLTQSRLFGVRSGAGWEAVDRRSSTRPARRSRRTSKRTGTVDECKTKKLAATMAWVSTTDSVPEAELQKLEAKALRDSRPDIGAADRRATRRPGVQHPTPPAGAVRSVVWASMGSSVGPGMLPALLGEIEPDAIAKLMTGIGDVDSAGIATQDLRHLADRARLGRSHGRVRRRPRRPARSRWRSRTRPTRSSFLAAVDEFMYEHGGRGPNEWDVYQRSYETNPTMLLQAIERTPSRRRRRRPRTLARRGALPSVNG